MKMISEIDFNGKLIDSSITKCIKLAKFSFLCNSEFVSVNNFENIHFWKDENIVATFESEDKLEITSLQFSFDGKGIIFGNNQGLVTSLDITTQKGTENTYLVIQHNNSHTDSVIVLKPFDQNTIISGSMDNSIAITDLRENNKANNLKEHTSWINDLIIDKFLIVSASNDETIKVWDIRNSKLLTTFVDHYSPVTTLCFGQKQKLLISSSEDNTIKSWDLAQLNQHSEITVLAPVEKMIFNQDESILFSLSSCCIYAWNTNLEMVNYLEIASRKILDTAIVINNNQLNVLSLWPQTQLTKSVIEINLIDLAETSNNKNDNDILIEQIEENDNQLAFSDAMQFDQCFYPNMSHSNAKKEDDIIQTKNFELKFSQLLFENSKKELYRQIEIIQDIQANHVKFKGIMIEKINFLSQIAQYWKEQKFQSALTLIIKQTNLALIVDCFYFIVSINQLQFIKQEYYPQLIEKAVQLLTSNHYSFVICGLEFLATYCRVFFTEKQFIIKKQQKQQGKETKTPDNKLKIKYDKEIQQLSKISTSAQLNLLTRCKDETVAAQAKKLQIQIVAVLNKLQC